MPTRDETLADRPHAVAVALGVRGVLLIAALVACEGSSRPTLTDTDSTTSTAETAHDTLSGHTAEETGRWTPETGTTHTGETSTPTPTGDTGSFPQTLMVPGCPAVFSPQPAEVANCGSTTVESNSYYGWRADRERVYDALGHLVELSYHDYYDDYVERYEYDAPYGDLTRIARFDPWYYDPIHVEDLTITRDPSGRPVLVHHREWFATNPLGVDVWDETLTWGPCGVEVVTSSKGPVLTTEYYVDGTRVWDDQDGDGSAESYREHIVDVVTGAPVSERMGIPPNPPGPDTTYTVDPVTGWLSSRTAPGPRFTTWTYDAHGRELSEWTSFEVYYIQQSDQRTTRWNCPP